MKLLVLILSLMLALTACMSAKTTTSETKEMTKRHVYCRTHAREFIGEADEEGHYRGCILMQGRHDVEVTQE